jgi:Holliday junction resolvasome RuvABC endonuclease subunit
MIEAHWQNAEKWFLALPFHTQCMLGTIFAFWLLFNIFYNEKAISFGPTILTTLGIFATFLGIALGLSEFNPDNIQASVPALLAGLKTAFWASVAGVGGALLLKFRHQFFDRTTSVGTGEDGEVTGADLALLLSGIQTALIGNEETSLTTQLKLLRSDTNDRLDALKVAQLQALQELSKMGSQALVEALRDVIKDFNAKISEQFGENFKALNEAVGKLLEWQNRYRVHIEKSEGAINDLVDHMTKVSSDYGVLVSNSQSFSIVASDLGRMLDSLSTQKEQLVDLSRSLAELLNKASESLPAVETKVVELANQLASAVQKNQQTLSSALAESALQLGNSIKSSHQGFVSTNAEANKQVTDLLARTKEQISVLDAALTEELKKSLESLGRQLAALSERFVNDYGPLTEKLRRVVELAK